MFEPRDLVLRGGAQGCPRSQIEKKSIKTISNKSKKTNQLRSFLKSQIEKKSLQNILKQSKHIGNLPFSKEGSGSHGVPQACPSSQTEKKSIETISITPKRKEINSDTF